MNRFQKLLNQHSSEEVMYKKIHEVCEIKNGYTSSKKNPDYWENGTIPWFRMEDIRENGKVLSDAIQHVTPEAIRGEPFPANSFIFATSVTIGEHALIEVPFLCNQRFTNVHIKDEYKDKLHYKYLFYYGDIIDDINKRMITGESSHPSVDIKKFKNIVIPIPPMPIQQEIVRNLDTFTELTAELTARKKQYEYYKNKLLVFDGGAELYELGEILVKTRGTSITARKMKELHKDEGLVRIFAGGKTYAEVNFDDIPENDINRNPSIIVKSRGNIEFEYYDKPFSHKNEFWSYYSDNERININMFITIFPIILIIFNVLLIICKCHKYLYLLQIDIKFPFHLYPNKNALSPSWTSSMTLLTIFPLVYQPKLKPAKNNTNTIEISY